MDGAGRAIPIQAVLWLFVRQQLPDHIARPRQSATSTDRAPPNEAANACAASIADRRGGRQFELQECDDGNRLAFLAQEKS